MRHRNLVRQKSFQDFGFSSKRMKYRQKNVRRKWKPKRRLKKSKLARQVKALVKKDRRRHRVEFFRSQAAVLFSSYQEPVHAWCINEPALMAPIWNPTALPVMEKCYHYSTGIRLFLSSESVAPSRAFFTVFLLKGKSALQRYLNANNELTVQLGTHYTTGTAGELVPGRTPGALINRELFKIVKFKRVIIGNQVTQGTSSYNLMDTSREFYFKIRTKCTYRAVQGNALSMTESQLPVTQRYYLLAISDEAPDTAQPPIWVNWVGVHKLDFNQ